MSSRSARTASASSSGAAVPLRRAVGTARRQARRHRRPRRVDPPPARAKVDAGTRPLGTAANLGDPNRHPRPRGGHRLLGSYPPGSTRSFQTTPSGPRHRPAAYGLRPCGHGGAARQRLRAKLSYTNIGFALAPPEFTISELSRYYRAASWGTTSQPPTCGGSCSPGQIEETGRSVLGTARGRPAALFRFAPARWRSPTLSRCSARRRDPATPRPHQAWESAVLASPCDDSQRFSTSARPSSTRPGSSAAGLTGSESPPRLLRHPGRGACRRPPDA